MFLPDLPNNVDEIFYENISIGMKANDLKKPWSVEIFYNEIWSSILSGISSKGKQLQKIIIIIIIILKDIHYHMKFLIISLHHFSS